MWTIIHLYCDRLTKIHLILSCVVPYTLLYFTLSCTRNVDCYKIYYTCLNKNVSKYFKANFDNVFTNNA